MQSKRSRTTLDSRLLIWGAGGHARVVADIARCRGTYLLAGFLDDQNHERQGATLDGATILGGRESLAYWRENGVNWLVVGIGDCQMRLFLADRAREAGFKLATLVHPSAVIASSAVLGAGTVVAAGAIINSGAVIGDNVIVNTGSRIDHECVVEDGAHICPGVTLAGNVHVERGAWVGIGSVVREKVQIGAGALIGAGAVVLDHIGEQMVAYGVPAKVVRERETG